MNLEQSEQSKAERIASELDSIEATPITCGVIHEAAFELRRLHAENERLREAVKAEREACAKMFDGEVWAYDYREIAEAIRARGK
jgi:hypothetical protein